MCVEWSNFGKSYSYAKSEAVLNTLVITNISEGLTLYREYHPWHESSYRNSIYPSVHLERVEANEDFQEISYA